jgi:hypothetical protein
MNTCLVMARVRVRCACVVLEDSRTFEKQLHEVRSDNRYFFQHNTVYTDNMLDVTLVKSVSRCLYKYQTCPTFHNAVAVFCK